MKKRTQNGTSKHERCPEAKSSDFPRKLDDTLRGRTFSRTTASHLARAREERGKGIQGGGVVKSVDVFAEWNAAAEANGWRQCKAPGESRSRSLRRRLKDTFFRDNWRDALVKMAGEPFFKGQNGRGWKANIDFFLRPDSVIKIMEDFYETARKPERKEHDHSKGFWPEGEQP